MEHKTKLNHECPACGKTGGVMENRYWTSEYTNFYLMSSRYASRRWWQFWIKPPKNFYGYIFKGDNKKTLITHKSNR